MRVLLAVYANFPDSPRILPCFRVTSYCFDEIPISKIDLSQLRFLKILIREAKRKVTLLHNKTLNEEQALI